MSAVFDHTPKKTLTQSPADCGKCRHVNRTPFAVAEDDLEGSSFNLEKSLETRLGHVATAGMTVDEEGLDSLSVNPYH